MLCGMNRQQASEKRTRGQGEETSKKTWSLKKLMSLKSRKKKMTDLHPRRSLQVVLTSSPFRWKRVKTIHHSFFDNVVFKVVSVCEGVVLVFTVCFFFLCCGCHF